MLKTSEGFSFKPIDQASRVTECECRKINHWIFLFEMLNHRPLNLRADQTHVFHLLTKKNTTTATWFIIKRVRGSCSVVMRHACVLLSVFKYNHSFLFCSSYILRKPMHACVVNRLKGHISIMSILVLVFCKSWRYLLYPPPYISVLWKLFCPQI